MVFVVSSDLVCLFAVADDGCHLKFVTMTHLAATPLHLAFTFDGVLWILVRSDVNPLLLVDVSSVLETKQVCDAVLWSHICVLV